MNKKLILWLFVAVLALIAGYLLLSSPKPSAVAPQPVSPTAVTPVAPSSLPTSGGTIEVAIRGFAFLSSTVRIAPGTIIIWKNYDDVPHSVVGAGFQSPILQKGQTYSHKFTTEGTFAYYCGLHPNMKGEIVVRGGIF